jgi:hypothetical protein
LYKKTKNVNDVLTEGEKVAYLLIK